MKNNELKVGVYLRVSTEDQTLDSQRHDITQWMNGNGIDPESVEWYADHSTGMSLERPEFERLQRDIFCGKIKNVIVYKLDRLSRSIKDGVTLLSDWLEKEIRVVSVTQQIDFSGATGKLMLAVFFALAEMEREVLRERQAAGIAVAKERGVYKGRKPGATKSKPGRAIKMREEGLTYKAIANNLGVTLVTAFRYCNGNKIQD